MAPINGKLTMEGAKIIFRNLAGREGKYNREGDRNFCVLLDVVTARAMEEDGWNIKRLRPREEDEGLEPQAYLPVSVSYKSRPPRVVLITSKGRTPLTEDVVEFVDMVDIKYVDLTINPYKWEVNGKGGVKAYLSTLYVIVHEDPLDLKYADLEELPTSSGRVNELEAAPEVEIIEGEWQ